MAWRVDEVDLRPLPLDGDVLREDRDATFLFQVVGVEDPLTGKLAGPKLAALPQQAVDERRFAVVDVGDDGEVTDIVAAGARGGGGRMDDGRG